jgi:hypothetical protein
MKTTPRAAGTAASASGPAPGDESKRPLARPRVRCRQIPRRSGLPPGSSPPSGPFRGPSGAIAHHRPPASCFLFPAASRRPALVGRAFVVDSSLSSTVDPRHPRHVVDGIPQEALSPCRRHDLVPRVTCAPLAAGYGGGRLPAADGAPAPLAESAALFSSL